MSEDPAGNDFSSDSHPKPVDGGGSSSGGGRKHRTRLERAERLAAAAAQLAQGQPLRQVATGLGVARRTLRDWCAAEPFAGLPPEVATCLATPAGARWLHRLVVVMHLIIALRAGAGVRLVCEFREKGVRALLMETPLSVNYEGNRTAIWPITLRTWLEYRGQTTFYCSRTRWR